MVNSCDNINSCHENIITNETPDGIRVICTQCKQVNVLRMDKEGRFNNRAYSKIFKRDLLQPGENLYYKIYPHKMSIC